MGVTQQSANNVQYGYGLVTASGQGTISARNTAFEPVTAGPNLIDGQWHHIVGVFNSTSSLQLYADGVLIATDPFAPVFNTGVNHLYIGGMVRANTDHVFEFGGRIDDAGLFTGTLTAGDIALIHALGRVAGIGLDQFDDAQTLLQQSVGSTATFGGYDWKHVTGLSGSVGTYGGSAASFDAFIVTGPSGAGLMMFQNIPVPEPSTGLLLMLGTVLLRHRKRRA